MGRYVTFVFCIGFLFFITPAVAWDLPDFQANDLEGESVSLSELVEDTDLVVISFWLADCDACNRILPYLQAFHETYGSEGLQTIIVYIQYQCSEDDGCCYLESGNFTMPILINNTGELQDLFSVHGFPHTVIVDPEGKLLYNGCGYCPGCETCIQQLIHCELLGRNPLPSEIVNLSDQ